MKSARDERRSLALRLPSLFGLAVAAACSSAIPHPNQSDAVWAQNQWRGTTLESLAQGRQLYVAKCAGCHQLHQPEERGAAEWRAVVEAMQEEQDVAVTTAEAERIYQYLVTTGRDVRSAFGETVMR